MVPVRRGGGISHRIGLRPPGPRGMECPTAGGLAGAPGRAGPDQPARRACRGVGLVVPDGRDVARVDAALHRALPRGAHVTLSADLGPEARYKRWLAVRRGAVKVVVGARSAVFAPVADLGLVVVWDDGDDLHAEPRAPYPHAREVLALRAHRCRAAALLGGFARTTEVTQLVASGWAAA